MMIDLDDDLRECFRGDDVFDKILNLEGEVYREQKSRKTLRIVQNDQGYFVKIHRGVSWKEILKNIFQLRWPVLGAQNEWRAIRRLEELGVATMKVSGIGIRGMPPAWFDSFIITRELENIVSLEDYSRNWTTEPPDFSLKHEIIRKIADIARRLHENGVNHRDFYICHFLLDLSDLTGNPGASEVNIYLIDLHRVQIRKRTPERWIIKDLAGLMFSSMDIGLTQRDIFRFLKSYRRQPLRTILHEEDRFWRQVYRRAAKLYEKHFRKLPSVSIPAP